MHRVAFPCCGVCAIQKFVAEPCIEALTVPVLPRRAWLDLSRRGADPASGEQKHNGQGRGLSSGRWSALTLRTNRGLILYYHIDRGVTLLATILPAYGSTFR